MKKLLALVLALALALPLGVTAFAADAEKIDLSLTGFDAGVLCDGDGIYYGPNDLIPPDSTVYLPFRIFAGEPGRPRRGRGVVRRQGQLQGEVRQGRQQRQNDQKNQLCGEEIRGPRLALPRA